MATRLPAMRGSQQPRTRHIWAYLVMILGRGAVDVVGRWGDLVVDQVGGGRERVREVEGRLGVATVESGVWRVRQST